MLISFSTLVLASQLIVTVADNVSKFNIERGYKVDSTASSLDTGLDETIKDACRMSNKGKTSFKRNGRNLPRPTG